jgi:RNA polymerase sigma-70 factor (ECF subfamily)
VFRFFRGKVAGGVEDLTQRTFAACLAAADRVRGEGSLRGWMLGIARNQLLRELRKRYRSEKVFDPATISIAQMGDAALPSAGTAMVAEESERLLLAALSSLPLDFQITLELYYWEDLPVAEIAVALDVAAGTVKSRLGRARAMLREEIERLAGEPGLARRTADDLERWARSVRDKV